MLRIVTGLVVASMLGLAACAGDVVDVDRTQPNKLSKATFQGEWYFLPTVVDVDYNQGLLFEGAMGEMDRIRWEIRENELIAYRSYEYLEGQEQNNNTTGSGGEFKGTMVAMFRILSHFDIRREYNPATGEQSNVLVENTVDRPWFEREHMRVDWSMNLIPDPYGFFGMVWAYSSAPYYVQEHEVDNEHRAEITDKSINVVGNYTMITDDYTCWYMLMDPLYCANSDVKVKLSFMKVGDRSYEPLYYPDQLSLYDDAGKPMRDCDGDDDGVIDGECITYGVPMFERFGYFRTERQAYDHEYQWTRDGRIYLANRWNIWKRSYNAQGQAIPLTDRQQSKITYYTNVDFPGDEPIWAASQRLVGMWDGAFKQTVAGVKNIPVSEVQPVFELLKNTCSVENATNYAAANGHTEVLAQYGIGTITRGNVKRACTVLEWVSQGDFTWQKPGDLRWSYLHWVDTAQIAGPLGYGPSAADPVTGETVAAYANIYGAALETYAAQAADMVQLMNGEIDLGEFAQGEYVRKQIERRRGFGSQGSHSSFAGAHSEAKMAELKSRMTSLRAEMNGSQVGQGADPRSAMETGRLTLKGRTSAAAREFAQLSARSKLKRVAGSQLEREVLVSDEMRRALQGREAKLPTGVEANDFSAINDMLEGSDRRRELELKLSKNGCVLLDGWLDDGLAAIAAKHAGKTWEEVYAAAREEVYEGVMAHEVGHTLGLRHNFEGSYDALNFHDGFWSNYNTTTEKVEHFNGSGAPTDAQLHMYSSIMDYMPRPWDDISGIGKYDVAAIKFGYGALVEVWEPGLAALYFDDLRWFVDYNDIPKLLTGDLSCTSMATCHPDFIDANDHYEAYIAAANANNAALARQEYELFNRSINSYLKKATTGRTPQPQNIGRRQDVPFQQIYEGWRQYYLNGSTDVFAYDEVSYMFCPDEWVYPGNLTCQRWDKGANYRELIEDRWQRYDQYYFFNNYRRDRALFNDYEYIDSYLGRLIERHFAPMSAVYRYYLYGFSGMGYDSDGNYLTLIDFPVGQDWQAAGMDGLNYLTAVLHQPEPGNYCLNMANNTYEPLLEGTCGSGTTLDVPVGVGKFYETDWNDEYYYEATRIGTFWDKYAALWAITDNEGFFYRDFSDYLDSGAFSLSYWRGLNTEMLDLFKSAFDGQSGLYSWRFDDAQTGDAKFAPLPVVDIYTNPVDANLPKIASSSSWTLRYYSVLLPMARFNSMYDYTPDFQNFTRVCLDGYQDCMDYAYGTAMYTDPLTQFTFIAPRTGQADGYDLAAQLLDEANDFATDVYAPALDRFNAAMTDAAWTDPDPNVWPANYDENNPDPAHLTVEEQAAKVAGKTKEELKFNREVELGRSERGVNERTSFLDVIRQLSVLTEFGG